MLALPNCEARLNLSDFELGNKLKGDGFIAIEHIT